MTEVRTRIPKAVVKRLSLYLRVLQEREDSGSDKISSNELAQALGFNSAQVRKDLAHFGQFGVPGFGYHAGELRESLKRILGTDRRVRVALVGMGNLGRALTSYHGFSRQGFEVVCAFDLVAGTEDAPAAPVPLFPVEELESRLKELRVDFAILTVPREAAQDVTNRLVEAGVTAILNFVPQRLSVPSHVQVHYVDLSIEMETLNFYIAPPG